MIGRQFIVMKLILKLAVNQCYLNHFPYMDVVWPESRGWADPELRVQIFPLVNGQKDLTTATENIILLSRSLHFARQFFENQIS